MSDAVNQVPAGAKIEPVQVIESWGLDYHLGCAVALIARVKRAERTYTRDELQQARAHLDRAWEQMQQLEQRQESRRSTNSSLLSSFEKVAAAFEAIPRAVRGAFRFGPYYTYGRADEVRLRLEERYQGEKWTIVSEEAKYFVQRVSVPAPEVTPEQAAGAQPPWAERPVHNVFGPYRTLEIAEAVALTLLNVRGANYESVKIGPNCFVREYLKETTAKS